MSSENTQRRRLVTLWDRSLGHRGIITEAKPLIKELNNTAAVAWGSNWSQKEQTKEKAKGKGNTKGKTKGKTLTTFFWSFLLVLYGLMLNPGEALAQSDLETDLAPITVTSTRVRRELKEIPLSVSVVSDKTIAENPKQEPAEYIRDLPGVQATQNSYGEYLFNLRGYSPERTLLLIDGVRQTRATALLVSEMGGLTLDPSDIERIEVVKGPASALYGSDAIGGVVNIITRKGGDKPFGFNLGLVYNGSNASITPRASFYGSQAGFYWRVSGMLSDSKNLKLPDGETLHHTGSHKEYFSLRSGYEWDRGSLDLAFSRYETGRDLPALEMANSHKNNQLSPEWMATNRVPYSGVPRELRQQATATLTFYDLTANLERLLIQGYVSRSDLSIDDTGVRVTPAGTLLVTANVKGRDQTKGFGGTVQADFTLPANNKLTLGFDFEHKKSHSLGLYGGYFKVQKIIDEDRKGQSTSMAFFLQNEWRPIDNLGLTLGLRHSSIINKLTEDIAFPRQVASLRNSAVVGSLGLVYDLNDSLNLRALYSQGFRSPTLTEQLTGGTQRSLANPDLVAERSNNYELGARYSADGLNADLSLFYSTLKDAFYDYNTDISNPMGGVYMQVRNANQAKSLGAELALSYDIVPLGLTPYVSLTAMRFEREYLNGKTTKNTGTPRSWGVGGVRFSRDFNPNIRIFADASLTWSGGFFDEPPGGVLSYTKFYDSGLWGDLTLGLEVGDEHKYRGTLSFKNIGDNNFEPWGYFQPGFHLVAAVGFEY
ncbi:MAG: TonB-dependent receptor [Deltaproteobacteria bacterium]|jgi:hemoglobin/transferrin/lactoferrin receptor protein|nr:TonB-dependent receptor [Deltaproteobacteria bacterium]